MTIILPTNHDENMSKLNYNSDKRTRLLASILEDYWKIFYDKNKELIFLKDKI